MSAPPNWNQGSRPAHIDPQHWREWLECGAAPEIIAASVQSIAGDQVYDHLCYSPDLERTNTGRLASKWIKRYDGLDGWWCRGLDPLNDWQPMTWGCLKPDNPRIDAQKGKEVKYESPAKTKTRVFFAPVPLGAGIAIAQKQGKEVEYVQRIWDFIEKSTGQPASAEAKTAVYRALNGGQHARACELLRGVLHQPEDLLREPGSVHPRGTGGAEAVWNQPLLTQDGRDTAESGTLAGGIYPSSRAVRAEGRIFWQWAWEQNIAVIVVEGQKKATSLATAGYAAIALPGVFNGYRSKDLQGNSTQPYLIPELRHFATPEREIYICFDHDTKSETVKNVNLATSRLGQLLTKAGCQVRVIELPGPEKGADDFITARGAGAFSELHDAALPLDRWRAQQYSQLTYAPSLALNQKYLGELPIPSDAKLICLKSPKGTGKTESLIPLVREATNDGRWVLLIGHRVQLVRAICERVGINYVTELKDSETGRLLGYGLCIDSLHPQSQAGFNAAGWNDGIVILDECEQVIWHLLNAHTEVKKRRVEVLQQLRQLLTQVLASDRGRVILSDADLSDVSINFVRGMASSSVEPWICLNTWKPDQPWAVHNYDQKNPIEWLGALEADIEGGGVPFIVTQGQKVNSKWGSQTLEAHLSQRFSNKRVLRIDSETIADPGHPAYECVTQLNQVLPQYDIVIASPTIETGVSIDIRGHFTGVWGCFQGVLPENTARQSLARVREPVPRHIWAPTYGIGKVANGETSLKGLLASEHKLAKAHIHLLQDASLVLEDEDTLNIDATALTAYSKMVCRLNAGMFAYQDSILNGLKAEGHYIIDAAVPGAEMLGLGEVITEVRDKNYQADCEAIVSAKDLLKDEFEKLSQLRAKTSEERQQERKYKLRQRYQVAVTTSLVTKDDDGWYAKLRLHYYLTAGKDHLKARDRRAAESIVQDGKAWLPDFNQSQLGAAIKTLEVLGVPKLIDPQREYRGTDKDLVQIAAMAIAHRRDIKLTLGILLKETDAPMLIAQKLLSKLGLRLTLVRKEGKRGNQQRVYTFAPPNDGRDEVFTAWLARDGGESQNVSSSDTVVRVPIYKNIDSHPDYQTDLDYQTGRESQNVSSSDTVVRVGNKEYINTDPDYQTAPDHQTYSQALTETCSPAGNSPKLECRARGGGDSPQQKSHPSGRHLAGVCCQLAVGDRVTVTSPGKYQGQAGRVAELDSGDGTYRLELDSGGEGWWRSDHLQAEGEQCPSQPDPKLGSDEWESY